MNNEKNMAPSEYFAYHIWKNGTISIETIPTMVDLNDLNAPSQKLITKLVVMNKSDTKQHVHKFEYSPEVTWPNKEDSVLAYTEID